MKTLLTLLIIFVSLTIQAQTTIKLNPLRDWSDSSALILQQNKDLKVLTNTYLSQLNILQSQVGIYSSRIDSLKKAVFGQQFYSYVVEKIGLTYYATPGINYGYPAFNNSNFSSVLTSVMNQLKLGGIIKIKDGIYDDAELLTILYSNIWIDGTSKFGTKIKLKAKADVGLTDCRGLFQADNVNNIKISNLDIDGNGSNQTKIDNNNSLTAFLSGILYGYYSPTGLTSGLVVENCSIHDFTQFGVFASDYTKNAVISNSDFKNNYWNNVTLIADNSKILNSNFYGSSDVSVTVYGNNNTIAYNNIYDMSTVPTGSTGSYWGIGVESITKTIGNQIIYNNITGPHIQSAIHINNNAQNFNVGWNNIYNLSQVYSDGINIESGSDGTITKNTIKKTHNDAIYLGSCTNSYIIYNTTDSIGGTAINDKGTGNLIKNNTTSSIPPIIPPTSITNVYTFNWNNVGKYPNTTGFNASPMIPNTKGNPAFPISPGSNGWGVNQSYSGNNEISSTVTRYPGQASLHLVLNPTFPAVVDNGNQTCYTNCRTEIYWGAFDSWIPNSTEIWTSWSVFYPYLSSILDQSDFAVKNFSENVIRQWGPLGSEPGPQIALILNSGYRSSDKAGNNVFLDNQAQGDGYQFAGGVSNSALAASLNYGHIVPGIWMDFTEHIIIDDSGKGCYQLWVTIPPITTPGYPADGVFTDTKYSKYSGTYLWFNYNNIKTTRDHTPYGFKRGSGSCKFGIYYGGPGWHNQSNSTAIGQASKDWMVKPLSQGGGGQPTTPPSTGGTPGQMEVYYSPIKVQYNSGTVKNGAIGPAGKQATSNYIDASGYQNVK